MKSAHPMEEHPVQDVINEKIRPAGDFSFGPYRVDKLMRRSSRVVEFHTLSHSSGLSTANMVTKNRDPIDGVVMLDTCDGYLFGALQNFNQEDG